MSFPFPSPFTKNGPNLSKLTKGVGEFYDEEKRVEIILDENDKIKKRLEKFLPANTKSTKTEINLTSSFNIKKEINLPKTYTTKKGALILFSEDIFSNDQKLETSELIDDSKFLEHEENGLRDMPIKTVNELQRNVLYYGIANKEKLPPLDNEYKNKSKNENSQHKDNDELITGSTAIENSMFSIVNMSTKSLLSLKTNNLSHDEQKEEENSDDGKLKRINRGFSAKRYLNNLTKHWDQNVLDTFISDGKIKQQTVYEKNEKNFKRKRIEDDLTLWPQAYRFDQNWISSAVDMRSYRFLKAQDYNFNKTNQGESQTEDERPKKKIHKKEPIKIFDQKHSEITYKSLNPAEKEKVLSELLFHSAMNNIKMQQANELSNTISYSVENNNNNDNSEKKSNSEDYSEAKKDPNVTPRLGTFTFAKSKNNLSQIIEKKILSEPTKLESKLEVKNKSSSETPRIDKIYMFGKYAGASWVSKRIATLAENQKSTESLPPKTSEVNLKKSIIIPQLQLDVPKIPNEIIKKTFQFNKLVNNNKKLSPTRRTSPEKKNDSLVIEKEFSSTTFRQNKDKQQPFVLTKQEKDIIADLVVVDPIEALINEEDILKLNKPRENQFDSVGHCIDTNEITPMETYLEDLKSTTEFAVDDGEPNEFSSSLNLDTKREANFDSIQIEKIDETQEVGQAFNFQNQAESKKISTLDKKLKRFSKPKKKIDINYAENEEKLFINLNIRHSKTKEKPIVKNEKQNESKKLASETITPTKQLSTITPTKQIQSTPVKEKDIKTTPVALNESESKISNYGKIPPASLNISKENSQDNFKATNVFESTSLLSFKGDSKLSTLGHPILPQSIKANLLNEKTQKDEPSKLHTKSPLSIRNYEETIVPLNENKLPLPKLNLNQEKKNIEKFDKDKENLSEKKFSSEKKLKLVYLEDEYAKVDTIKLKPKPENSEKLKLKSSLDSSSNKSFPTKRHEPASFKQSNVTKENNTTESKPNLYNQSMFNFSNFGGLPSDNYKFKSSVENKENDMIPHPAKLKTIGDRPNKRTIDWTVGDFDPRECFVLWSYEIPLPPIVVNKAFADALRKYAELLAKHILGRKHGGLNLSDDLKRALRENLLHLMEQIAQGKIGRELLDEYKKIFKQVLAKLLKRKDLENVEISDEMLLKLLELPPEAFEIWKDPETGKEYLRVRSAWLREQAKLFRNVVTQRNLGLEDFDVYIDPVTGEKKYRLKADVARQLGIPEGYEDMFEVYTDEYGNQLIRLKGGAKTITIGDTTYELVYDPVTGKQILRMVTKQKVGQETLEDILRLAANMTPETRNRYFQELLKTSGGSMSDEMRRRIIEEMMKNAANLSEESRNNLLKTLMTDLVNQLPPDLAQKVLADIMKATDLLDPSLKEKMIQNLLENMNDLPEELREKALKELVKNLDNLTAEQKQRLLENILNKVEELGISSKEAQELRNQVLKEMLINANNFDEETRNRIIKQVLDKVKADGGDVPQSLLEELVKMGSLPDDIKELVLNEIKKSLEAGNLDAKVLAGLLRNSDMLNADILAAIAKNADKMDDAALQELMKNLDKLPDELKSEVINKMLEKMDKLDSDTLKELMRNLDKLPDDLKAQVIHKMMENIENMDKGALQELMKNLDKLPDHLKAEIINKMIENMDKMDKGALEELMRNMDKLPDELKAQLIHKMLENMDKMDTSTLNELMKNLDKLPDDLKAEVIHKMLEHMDKMDSSTLNELLKNMDSLPDELKAEIMKKLIENIENLDPSVKQQLLKELLSNPNLIQDEALREKVIKEILRNMTIDDILRDTANMTAEERHKYYQDLLRRAGDLPDDVRQKLIELMLKNAENLDEETRNNMLKDFVNDIVKFLPPDVAAKVLADLMKSTENLDPSLKAKMLENLLKNIDDLPPELRQQALSEIAKNLDDLSAEQKEAIFKTILASVDSLPPELRDKTLKSIIDNMNNLSAEVKNALLQEILEKVEAGGGDSEFSKQLRNEVLKEIIKNSQNLDEETRRKILKDVMEKLGDGDVPDIILQELVKQLDSLPDSIKQSVLNEIKKNIAKGNIDAKVLDELLKNAANLPPEILEQLISNIKNLAPEALNALIKNLDKLPEHLKQKALQDMLSNIKNLDPSVQNQLLKELLSNPNLIKDKAAFEKAVLSLIENLADMPENVRRDMLKNLARNLDNLSDEMKKHVMKEMLNNLANESDETREEVLKALLKKMGQKELEEWIRNSDLPDDVKRKMLADIQKLIESGDYLWDSDDEKELEGLSPEERARRKREMIEKRKQQLEEADNNFQDKLYREKKLEKKDLSWLKKNQEKIFKTLVKNDDGTIKLTADQTEFLKAFNKLSDEEKAKFLENLSEEERQAFLEMQAEYEKMRQKELEQTLIEAKNLAIQKLREKLALRKRLDYMNFLRVEQNMFNHAQQLTRAFVFSYFDMMQWLEVSNDQPIMVE